jgi:thiamine biosynthesis lipoprotein
LLADILATALRAAAATDGLVDPTVGQAVADLGYDRDYAAIRDETSSGGASTSGPAPRPAPGWWRIQLDQKAGRVLLPRRIALDLGATGKAFAADRAAARMATLGCGVLVSLGGDLATAGPPPDGGWLISVGDDHRVPGEDDPVVTIRSGALATSSVTQRRWRRGDRMVHHIVDPRTGDLPEAIWRTVSVAARSCVDANTAATAAIVRGVGAQRWLRDLRLPARLVRHDDTVVTVAGWPGTGSTPS